MAKPVKMQAQTIKADIETLQSQPACDKN